MSEKLKPAVLVPAHRAVNVKQYEQAKITKSHGGRVATISWKTKGKKLNTLTLSVTDDQRTAVSAVCPDESGRIAVFRGAGGNFFVGNDWIGMDEGMWGNPNHVM